MPSTHGAFDEYAALVFDCDGTLVDTMPVHYIAWLNTLKHHGLDYPEARFYANGGMSATGIITMLADEAGVTLDAVAVAEQKEHEFTRIANTLQPIHAVVEIARQYRGVKPIAVATGSPQWVADHSLNIIGIRDWFEIMVTCDDVARPKPAPDTYTEVARRLNIPPEQCVAFEDGEAGMQSARAAGMHVVDVRPMYRASGAGGGYNATP